MSRGIPETTASVGAAPPAQSQAPRPRVLWVQTQPEHYFNRMIDDLNARGEAEFIPVFLGRGPGQYKDLPVPKSVRSVFLRRLPGKEDAPFHFWRKLHLDWRADLYPLHYQCAFIAGYGGRTQREFISDCRNRGIPVFMYADSNIRSQRGNALGSRVRRRTKRLFLRRVIASVDKILPPSPLGVAYWRYYGAPLSRRLRGGSRPLRDKLVLASCYADYATLGNASSRPRAECFGALGLDPNKHLLFTAARLIPAKGLHLMIEAFRASGLAGKGYIWAVAGSGPLEQQLKAQAGELLNKSIFFLGFVQPADMLALTAHAALFVLPSTYEPHGIVIQEAMAAGTPVLASDVCGAAFDLVRPGETGWTFKSGDAAGLRRRLLQATATPALLPAMRDAVRVKFDAWFVRTNPVVIFNNLVRQAVENELTTHGRPHGLMRHG